MRFKKRTASKEPLFGPDGTMIFQHPTVPNYYENRDVPELKGNPFANMMYYNPVYDPCHPASMSPEITKQFTSAKRKNKITRISQDYNHDIYASNTSINIDKLKSAASKTESKYVYPDISKQS